MTEQPILLREDTENFRNPHLKKTVVVTYPVRWSSDVYYETPLTLSVPGERTEIGLDREQLKHLTEVINMLFKRLKGEE